MRLTISQILLIFSIRINHLPHTKLWCIIIQCHNWFRFRFFLCKHHQLIWVINVDGVRFFVIESRCFIFFNFCSCNSSCKGIWYGPHLFGTHLDVIHQNVLGICTVFQLRAFTLYYFSKTNLSILITCVNISI